MCGIAGFVGEGTRDDLVRMTRALSHRGPDDEGFYIDACASVHLGHRRLSILDIRGGRQPMWNEDRNVAVIFNGEIYNHAELRIELIAHGHRFSSDHSDTEVLIHGYEQWGTDLPIRLNGMFAFAIFDRQRHRIFLARDRFGEKPIYYSSQSSFIAFASELFSVAQHPKVSTSLSLSALRKLFAYGYIPAPFALLEGTNKLPGGHMLIFDWLTGKTVVRPYWRFAIEPDEGLGPVDESRLIEELGERLTTAARRRLMSDVPLGVFLSGGVDSGTVLALLTRDFSSGRLHSFTSDSTRRHLTSHLQLAPSHGISALHTTSVYSRSIQRANSCQLCFNRSTSHWEMPQFCQPLCSAASRGRR
jgi:asparagine synthase (glutamine-hydrolysing)